MRLERDHIMSTGKRDRQNEKCISKLRVWPDPPRHQASSRPSGGMYRTHARILAASIKTPSPASPSGYPPCVHSRSSPCVLSSLQNTVLKTDADESIHDSLEIWPSDLENILCRLWHLLCAARMPWGSIGLRCSDVGIHCPSPLALKRNAC